MPHLKARLSCRCNGAPPALPFLVPDTAAFLRLLDLSAPQLAPVRAALDRGDVDAAARACCAHFRQRKIDSPLLTDWRALSRSPKVNPARADAFLAGRLHDGCSAYEVRPAGLDWRESPLSCVTRFPLLGPVCAAYHHTRDPKHARWMVEHMLGYIRAWPEEYAGHNSRQGWTSHTIVAQPWYWCMVPERLMEMSESILLLRDCPEVTDADLQLLAFIRG